MDLLVTFNGESTGNGFLIAPDRGEACPAPLGLKTEDGTRVSVRIEVSPPGAGIRVDPPNLYVDGEEKTVWVHPTGPSAARNDVVLRIFEDDVMEATVNLTVISNPGCCSTGVLRFVFPQARASTTIREAIRMEPDAAGCGRSKENQTSFPPTACPTGSTKRWVAHCAFTIQR